jgi:phosphatidylinositol-3-phosphatase
MATLSESPDMSNRLAIAPLALVACCVLASCGGSPAPAKSDASSSHGTVPTFGHVFLIVGENTSAAQITPSHAPFLTKTLKPTAAWLTNYHSFKKSSSLGQYIALVSGQYTKCEANNDLPVHCHQNVPNLFQRLDSSGRTWHEWNESMDNACDYVDHGSAWSKNIYSAHHNAAIYFTGIEGGVYDEARTPKGVCLANDLSMGTTAPDDTSAFDLALGAGKVADFNLIVPNDCENGHDPCGTKDPVKQFDDFLRREVPSIRSSPAFGADGLIVVTWDEGADPPQDPAHVLTILVGSQVKPGTYATALNHYSLSRTLASGFGLQPFANAKKARPLPMVWK